MEKPISFIIPNVNTKKYLEWCYNSIRKNLGYYHEIVLLDDGSTDDSWEWIQEIHKKDKNTKIHKNHENIGIAYSYNKAVELATNEIVCLLHSDMYIPPKFDEIMLKHMEKYDFVTAWRVEPAIYPESKDKHQEEFGRKLSEFDEQGFLDWNEKNIKKNKDKDWIRACFPWMTTKKLFEEVGGVDCLFLKYMVDDDDLYLRVAMTGAKMMQTFETAVYHMCSRSTKYKDDEINDNGTDEWNKQHLKSTRNFIRKWGAHQGSIYIQTENGIEMVSPRKYDIGFVIKNATDESLSFFEPWCSTVYLDDAYLIQEYFKKEQVNTLYDLTNRVKLIGRGLANDVLVEFDALKMNDEGIDFLTNLSKILNSSGEVGEMKWNNFNLHIRSLETKEHENIVCKNKIMYLDKAEN